MGSTGSPADHSMLAVGDVITSVNDTPVVDVTHSELTLMLKHTSEVTLGVRRAQQRAYVEPTPFVPHSLLRSGLLSFPLLGLLCA